MQRVDVRHAFAKPPERVFAYLAEHEHLEPVLGAKVTRLRDGTDGRRNGVGSVRNLRIGVLPSFDETNVLVDEPERLEYRITRGSPLSHHHGTMTFEPRADGGTDFRWVIELGSSPLDLVARIVRLALTRSIGQALPTVEREA